MRKKCHEILDQISDERLADALSLLTEMRDRKEADYVSYIDGMPVYKMGKTAHVKRLLMEVEEPTAKLKN